MANKNNDQSGEKPEQKSNKESNIWTYVKVMLGVSVLAVFAIHDFLVQYRSDKGVAAFAGFGLVLFAFILIFEGVFRKK